MLDEVLRRLDVINESARGLLITIAGSWEERAKFYRSELGDLDAAHRCELRAFALHNGWRFPQLNGYTEEP